MVFPLNKGHNAGPAGGKGVVQPVKMTPDPKYDRLRQIALLTAIPMVLMTGPACGYFMGHFIDQYFKTDPWFMILFVVIGGIAGVREMIRLIARTNKE